MRVVVLGAGYAGITVARRLEARLPNAADLVVVNDAPDHLVRHEVHRVLRRPSIADAIEVPLTDCLDRAELAIERVDGVDPERGRVSFAGGGSMDYDYAAVCLGAETAFYDLPGVREHATPLREVEHAERIRERFLDVCATGGRVVVGGAGLSGVQVAGELAALADEESATDVDIVLAERLDSVAPEFPSNFQSAVRTALGDRGVRVRMNAPIDRATAEAVVIDSEHLPTDQFVWTGGIRGPEATDGDRPIVRRDLRIADSTFGIGDAVRIVDADGEAVPASASAAVREGRTVASNLRRLVEHDLEGDGGFEPRLRPYRFDVPGWIVSVGDGAVAQIGPTVVTGATARAMKATVGAGHLTSVGAIRRAASLVEQELDA